MTYSPAVKAKTASLQSKRKLFRYLLLVEIAILLVALVLLFSMGLYAFYIALTVAFLLELCVIFPLRRALSNRFTEANAIFGVGAAMTDTSYERKFDFSVSVLEDIGLYTHREWKIPPIGRNSLHGRYRGMPCLICECSFGIPEGARNRDTRFLSGSYVEITLPQSLPGEMILLYENMPCMESYNREGMLQYTLSHMGSKAYAELLLSPSCAEILTNSQAELLTDMGRSPMAFSAKADRLVFILPNRFFAGHYRVNEEINQAKLTYNLLPELERIFKYVDSIAESAMLFNKKSNRRIKQ